MGRYNVLNNEEKKLISLWNLSNLVFSFIPYGTLMISVIFVVLSFLKGSWLSSYPFFYTNITWIFVGVYFLFAVPSFVFVLFVSKKEKQMNELRSKIVNDPKFKEYIIENSSFINLRSITNNGFVYNENKELLGILIDDKVIPIDYKFFSKASAIKSRPGQMTGYSFPDEEKSLGKFLQVFTLKGFILEDSFFDELEEKRKLMNS